MRAALDRLKPLALDQVVKAVELCSEEGEGGFHGLEKEFAFLDASDLEPLQRVGRHSAYKFIWDHGAIPGWMRPHVTPEVFDYMVEVVTEPQRSARAVVREILHLEAMLWTVLGHVEEEFPGLPRVLLSQGTLPKPASLDSENVPEVWGRDKRAYLETMVRRYGDRLTPQGMHGNISVPEPLVAYQYHAAGHHKDNGALGYVQFKNEVYVNLASRLRAFAALFIAIEAGTPFDTAGTPEGPVTVITGMNSSRWLRLPQIASSNCPDMLRDYEHFQRISREMIDAGIIIGANNYMPVRPKGDRSLGEVPLSLERAAWFHDVRLDRRQIAIDEGLAELRGHEEAPFLTRLELADRCGWLEKQGYTLRELMEAWHRDNVRRLLGVPLNRIEIRCEEGGGSLEVELARAVFREVLALTLFARPDVGAAWTYSGTDVHLARANEVEAARLGLDAGVLHPFDQARRLPVRAWLEETLDLIEPLAKEMGYEGCLTPLREYARGAKNEAVMATELVLDRLGPDPERTPDGMVIVPDECVRDLIERRRRYVLEDSSLSLHLDLSLDGQDRHAVS